jgi:hypothetical protein
VTYDPEMSRVLNALELFKGIHQLTPTISALAGLRVLNAYRFHCQNCVNELISSYH